MGHFRRSFLSWCLHPPEFYDFPYVSGIVEVTLPQPRKQLSIINHLAKNVWETLVGVCWYTVDRVCRHSYPQITLYWAAGRRRGCRGMKSSSIGPCVPLIEAQRASPSSQVYLQPSEQLFLPITLHFTGALVTPACTLLYDSFLIPFILLLCCFLTDCPTGPDSQDQIAASQPWFLTNIFRFVFFNQPFILTACNLVHWLLFLSASTVVTTQKLGTNTR